MVTAEEAAEVKSLASKAKSFRETFPGNTDMQAKAFASAVKSLDGAQLGKGEDPVAAHFDTAFGSLQGVDLITAKGKASGTLAESLERLNALYTSINNKVGYSLPSTLGMKSVDVADADGKTYAEALNGQLSAAAEKLQNARLAAFAKSFA